MSFDWALYSAITAKSGKVGIDIERMKPMDFVEFRNYITPEEWNTLQEAPNQLEYFYELWTAKESVIKGE